MMTTRNAPVRTDPATSWRRLTELYGPDLVQEYSDRAAKAAGVRNPLAWVTKALEAEYGAVGPDAPRTPEHERPLDANDYLLCEQCRRPTPARWLIVEPGEYRARCTYRDDKTQCVRREIGASFSNGNMAQTHRYVLSEGAAAKVAAWDVATAENRRLHDERSDVLLTPEACSAIRAKMSELLQGARSRSVLPKYADDPRGPEQQRAVHAARTKTAGEIMGINIWDEAALAVAPEVSEEMTRYTARERELGPRPARGSWVPMTPAEVAEAKVARGEQRPLSPLARRVEAYWRRQMGEEEAARAP